MGGENMDTIRGCGRTQKWQDLERSLFHSHLEGKFYQSNVRAGSRNLGKIIRFILLQKKTARKADQQKSGCIRRPETEGIKGKKGRKKKNTESWVFKQKPKKKFDDAELREALKASCTPVKRHSTSLSRRKAVKTGKPGVHLKL